MVPLAITRHALTQWNVDKRYQGRRDIPILESSRRALQATALPAKYDSFQLYSSPLQRARQSLEALTDRPYTVVETLRECDFGLWEGEPYSHVIQDFPHRDNGFDGLDYREHQGESYRDLQERVIPWILSLEKPSFVMAHKALLTAVYAFATDWDMLQAPAHRLDFHKIQRFVIDGRKLHLEAINEDFIPRSS